MDNLSSGVDNMGMDLTTEEQTALRKVRQTRAAVIRAQAQLRTAEQNFAGAIGDAFEMPIPRTAIEEASGVSRCRINQIWKKERAVDESTAAAWHQVLVEHLGVPETERTWFVERMMDGNSRLPLAPYLVFECHRGQLPFVRTSDDTLTDLVARINHSFQVLGVTR